MHTLLALLLFVVVFVVPNQVIAEDNAKQDFQKRQVSVLARDGHLPYEGKRYIGQKQDEGKTPEKSWKNENIESDPSVYLMTNKRYVGALAKSGDLRFKQQDDKREDVDTLIEELLTAEELRRIRLEALREELLKQQEDDEETAEKRSVSSLARTGGFPGKRGISSMARAGYLRSPASFFSEGLDKRGISSLARNGLLPLKRGGISSLMRNGYGHQKRSFDSEFDNQLLDEEDIDDKRNIGSLARSFTLPSTGKRNIAAFARNGWLQNIGPNAKKSSDDGWDTSLDEYKRNLQALLKNRISPFTEGKRYLGAFVANNRLPYSRAGYDDSKRNIGAMARSWNLPQYGKRSWDDSERELLDKIYLSTIMGEGSLPFTPENVENFDSENFNFGNDGIDDDFAEDKRHIGSFMAQKSFAMRKKKSISPEDQFGEQPPTPSTTLKSRTDENKMNNEIQKNHRSKREAFADFSTDSDEYPMPVMQNTDTSEYEDGNSRSNVEEQSSARKKRYFGALARNGWLPNNHYYKGAVSKRHIGALARLGWLPSFRSARAYSRFGRDTRSPCKRNSPALSEGRWEDPGRPPSSRWAVPLQQPQLWASSPLEGTADEDVADEDLEDEDAADPVKRYLLIPALDNILLRRQPINWIH